MEKILFASILGGLYGALVGYVFPDPYSWYVMFIGAAIIGWYSSNIFKALFGR